MAPPTPTHDNISNYATTYNEGTHVLRLGEKGGWDVRSPHDDQEGTRAQKDIVLSVLSDVSCSIL